MRLLYKNEYDGAQFPNFCSPLKTMAHAVANDACYTYANLVFSTQSVAFAVALFSAQIFNLPMMFQEEEEEDDPNEIDENDLLSDSNQT